MNYNQIIESDGYIHLKNIYSKELLQKCNEEILNYNNNNNTFESGSGYSIPDFVNNDKLKLIASLKYNNILKEILDKIFLSNDYRFCSHNDIGINRIVGWHKDKLNGNVEKYQVHNIWEDFEENKFKIIKVLIYLQDHSNNNDALKVIPRSHLTPEYNQNNINFVQLKPSLGDVIIFDQRITHRGMMYQTIYPRILVSFGFGANNIFTDEFEKGTKIRQNYQNNMLS